MARRAVSSPVALVGWQLLPAPEQPAADRTARRRLVDRVEELIEQARSRPSVEGVPAW
jgi:hypothetical protein